MKLGVHTENEYVAKVARVSTSSRLKSTVVRAVCDIQFDKAEIRFGQPNTHRPYLYLSGNVVEAHGDFPCGVSHIAFRDVSEDTRMTFRLEFTKEEIKSLVDKGLYDVPLGEFKCPDIFTEETFTFGDDDGNIGIDLKCSYIEPETEADVPVFFVGIVDQNREAFADDTGYTDPALSEYFDEFKSPWFEHMATPESRYEAIHANEPDMTNGIEDSIENGNEDDEYDEYAHNASYTSDTAYDDSESEYEEPVASVDDYTVGDDDFAEQMQRISEYVEYASGESQDNEDVDDDDYDDEEYYDDDDEYDDEAVVRNEPVGRKSVPDIDTEDENQGSQFGE